MDLERTLRERRMAKEERVEEVAVRERGARAR